MIRVISYNLLKGRAFGEVEELIRGVDHADVLCLQEANVESLPERIGDLVLVDATRRNRLGLALYLRPERFTVEKTAAYELKKSMHDHLFDPGPERLVGALLHDLQAGRDIVLASFHAAPLTATNSLRRAQIKAAHGLLGELGGGAPVIMVGDYNYPLFHGRLAKRMSRTGFDLVLSDKRTYSAYKIFRGHFDFVTSQGMQIDRVETLTRGRSDHLPIAITADYREVVDGIEQTGIEQTDVEPVGIEQADVEQAAS